MELENVNSKANVGVTLGAIGTGLGILGMHNGLGGLFNFGGNGAGFANAAATMMCGQSAPISRYELDMSMALAKKDSEIALLKSEQNTEIKIADVYERLITRINSDARAQSAWNTQQSVNEARMADALAYLRATCEKITKTVVPNSAICPGWGDVTVEPATPTP